MLRECRRNASSESELASLNKYAWGHERLSISSGFSGLLWAMHACRSVSLYGFDLAGGSPGHYFDDATEGVVARLQDLLSREPHRRRSLSVDPGIEGVSFMSSRRTSWRRERAKHAMRAEGYRRWIAQQYTNETASHPYPLERGLLRIFAERGCIRLGMPGTLAHTRSFAGATWRPRKSGTMG